jgi:geranylgeranyl reductase family protein
MAAAAYDVIVAGAGPAGSSAAAVLGAHGRRVLLVDKTAFPREKTCGDGLTFKCYEPLARLGVLEEFLGAVRFSARGYTLGFTDRTELTVRRTVDGERSLVHVLPRYEFDDLLLRAARRQPGVDFASETKVGSLLYEDGRVTGVTVHRHGEETRLRAPLVVDACGANSPLAVQAGAGNTDPHKCALAVRGYYRNVEGLSDTIELYFARDFLPGYFWIFPTSETSANVGVGTFQHIVEQRRLDVRKLMQDFIDGHPTVRRKLGGAEVCGTLSGGKIPLAIDCGGSRVRDGFLMIGDAASFTDPITAEGISYAMHSGIMAGDVAHEALAAGDTSVSALAPYDDAWRARFGGQFAKAAVLTQTVPKEAFLAYMTGSFEGNGGATAAIGDLALQYELMVKLKVLLKAL